MKKLVLLFAIIGFVAFGALNIQNLTASSAQVEMVKFDKDPKKDGDKKVTATKDSKTEVKAASNDTKVSSSTSSDKSAGSRDCCDKEKSGCCNSSPDKK